MATSNTKRKSIKFRDKRGKYFIVKEMRIRHICRTIKKGIKEKKDNDKNGLHNFFREYMYRPPVVTIPERCG